MLMIARFRLNCTCAFHKNKRTFHEFVNMIDKIVPEVWHPEAPLLFAV